MNVLSIDGGGIRGIIPAIVLAEIEERTGKSIAESFDLMAGTSTGGLIALILNVKDVDGKPKFTAREVAELYKNRGHEIFNTNLMRKIQTGLGLAEEAYSNAGLKNILKEYLGEKTLRDTITEVIIPAYETERRKPWFFKSINAKNPEMKHRNYRLFDVAMGTTAAPTYFEAHKAPYREDDYLSLVDGGVYANNPAMCAYIDATTKVIVGGQVKSPNEITLLSLGTGQATRKLMHDEIINWGLYSWGKPLISCFFDGNSDTVDYQLSKLLEPNQYFRLQKELTSANDDMDIVTEENIRMLKLEADEIIDSNRDTIQKIADLIK